MISESTRQVIDIFIRIIFYSGFVAGPIMILIILMYQYEKYKKWKDKETREAERIIVKMNEDIVKTGNTVNALTARETELKLAIDSYESRLRELKAEAGEAIDESNDDASEPISTELTIKELHALARERKVKGFSRMKKEDLIKILGQ